MNKWCEDKISRLKEAITKETLKSSSHQICVHGEIDCLRCMEQDLNRMGENESGWELLGTNEMKRIMYSLPPSVVEGLVRMPKKAVLAGGYIRALVGNERPKDIDIFVNDKTQAKEFLMNYPNYKVKDHCLQTKDGNIDVQVIWEHRFAQPVDLLEIFDYTVVKAAIWFDEGSDKIKSDFVSICHDRFYRDLARKVLVCSCPRERLTLVSIPRLLRYVSYGYSIEPEDLAGIIANTCLNLDLSNGFDGIKKALEKSYQPFGEDKSWEDMTKVYTPPQRARNDYLGSGS